MKTFPLMILSSVSLLTLPALANAEVDSSVAAGATLGIGEIIVTARRKDERLEDVPVTVNVVTSEDINNLNIRTFTDVQTLMPGLTLSSVGNTLANAVTSVRGVDFNQFVSGNSNVIEFYLDDSPLPSTLIFQSIYDIGQVELLRGPQGTLRGRSSPAGSMTMTTRRPDLNDFGGYVNATGTDIGGKNINGGLNIPLITDKLAVRVAGLYDENEGDRVRSINNPEKPFNRTKSGRISARFDPIDSLSFNLMYQRLELASRAFTQVENVRVNDGVPSATRNPGFPGSPSDIFIKASDRLAVADTPGTADTKVDLYNLQAQWSFLGQRLNYVGNSNQTLSESTGALDTGDYFGPTDPAFLQGSAKTSVNHTQGQAHELRLSSDERIFGMLDYLVGAFYEQQTSTTNLLNGTFLLAPVQRAIFTPIDRLNYTQEQSYFANLTVHIGSGTEITAGGRHIHYKVSSDLVQSGVVTAAAAERGDTSTNIWTASIKQRFNDNLMAYATVGTSWRPDISVIGDFNLKPSPLELTFLHLPAEKSKAFELGLKASALDQRLRASLAFYHQTYDNSPYRSPNAIFFANTAAIGSPPSPVAFNLAAAVPVTVNGVEGELSFSPINAWDMGINASYAKSKIDNGLVPCNDYLPHDGKPDTGTTPPTIGQILGANPPQTVTGCVVNYRATQTPKFSSTVQSEYRFPIVDSLNGYVRGLLSYYGSTESDPTNPIDDVDSYSLLNLYVGIRDPKGAWEVSLYGKNVADKQVTLTRSQIALSAAIRAPALPFTTNYRLVNTAGATPPREFGLNVRWSFGSR